MNRKVLAFASLLMILPISTTTFAYAAPWVEKKNDKFQIFETTGTFSVIPLGASAERTYIPSFDVVEKMIIAWSENYITFQIKVGEEIYQLNTHFEVSGVSKHTYWKPVFAVTDTAKLVPVASRAVYTTAKYTFIFKQASGLDGSFSIQTTVNEGNHRTTSLSGTGDFKNVQIQAEVGQSMALPLITITNEGLVIGWPELNL